MEDHYRQTAVELAGDVGSIGISLGSIAGLLPSVLSILAIIWVILRLYEIITGEKFATTHIARLLTHKDRWFKKKDN